MNNPWITTCMKAYEEFHSKFDPEKYNQASGRYSRADGMFTVVFTWIPAEAVEPEDEE